jgi:hypothetical protein
MNQLSDGSRSPNLRRCVSENSPATRIPTFWPVERLSFQDSSIPLPLLPGQRQSSACAFTRKRPDSDGPAETPRPHERATSEHDTLGGPNVIAVAKRNGRFLVERLRRALSSARNRPQSPAKNSMVTQCCFASLCRDEFSDTRALIRMARTQSLDGRRPADSSLAQRA